MVIIAEILKLRFVCPAVVIKVCIISFHNFLGISTLAIPKNKRVNSVKFFKIFFYF